MTNNNKIKETILYQKNDITIKKINHSEYGLLLDHITYENKDIIFSRELTFLEQITKTTERNSETDVMLELGEIFTDMFNKSKEKNEIINDSFTRKKDRMKMFIKTILSNSFSDDVIYNYRKKTYSQIDEPYRYDFLIDTIKSIQKKYPELKENEIENLINVVENIEDVDTKNKLLKEINDGYITIYRGFNSRNNKNGKSYTISKKIAEHFAKRYEEDGCIKRYIVKLKNIITFINTSELEIITENAIFKGCEN